MDNHTLKLPLDKEKRHFVVGDAHGRYDAFLDLLNMIEYNPETDIIYSVGDIIDRGPKSYEMIKFFMQENNHMILGNHEHMVINPTQWRDVWVANGGIQCMDSLRSNKEGSEEWMIEFFQTQPYIIDVGEQGEDGAFRLVHAEIPPEWSEDDLQQLLERIEDFNDREAATLLWARNTIYQALSNLSEMIPLTSRMNFVDGRSGRMIFCGHTPTEKALIVGDMMFIDTWESKTLTMVNALTKEKFVVKV